MLGAAHAPAAPQIAVDIAAEAVGRAPRLGGDETAAVRELVVVDVVDADHSWDQARFDDIELLLVVREGKSVRAIDLAGHHRSPPGLRIEAVQVGRQFGGGHVALVVAQNAEGRIAEPDRVVGFDHDVVRRVERLAVELVHQHGDRAVVFGARHAPAVVLAGDESALAVARIAVGVVRRGAVHAGASRPLVPTHDAVVGNIAPEQAARVAEIDRPLAPAHAGCKPLHARLRDTIFRKGRIENLDRRVGIARVRLPAAERRTGECHCGRRPR